MCIWSVHPSLLDAKGLVACWRETLLAQKVLQGLTKGYKNHPRLDHFSNPPAQRLHPLFYAVCRRHRALGETTTDQVTLSG